MTMGIASQNIADELEFCKAEAKVKWLISHLKGLKNK